MVGIKISGLWGIALVVIVVLESSFPAFGKVIYVDADAPGPFHTGSTWTYAYKHIRDALIEANFSVKPVEIHVAQGIYRPDETSTYPGGTGDLFATFQLINGVILKGGYAGNGQPDPDERDISIYETILSGDLSGNDVPVADPRDLLTEPTRVDNSYHVVTGSYCYDSAVLDGFTITAGNANGTDWEQNAGGMYNISGSPTLTNCTFSQNAARSHGGGMYNRYSSPTLNSCTFIRNSAYYGGGMYGWGSSPILTKCVFKENAAAEKGGGMFNQETSSPMLTKCTFSDNWSGNEAGGMCNFYYCSPKVTDCIFSYNRAELLAGGMKNQEYTDSIIENCTFMENWAGHRGGGMYNFYYSKPVITNCIFSGNSADVYGGGMVNQQECDPIIANSLLVDNWAGFRGGGMYNWFGCSPTLVNCTFSGNSAPNGNALGCGSDQGPSSLQLSNCILWDGGNEIWNNDGSTIMITYSDVQGGWTGQGNINTDPFFADSINGDFHLKSEAGRWNPDSESWIKDDVTSPCIDAGDSASDWKAEFWPHGCLINMGAYGNTPEASMSLLDPGSIADIDVDGQIGGKDTKLLIDKWLFEEVLLPEDLNRDGNVNFADYAIFAHIRGLPSASIPNPANGAIGVSTTADLSWVASPYAISYDVYFGTSNPPPFIGNQSNTTYDPGTMDYSTTYYWRIDSVGDAGKTNGLVWSFTTFSSPPPPPPL